MIRNILLALMVLVSPNSFSEEDNGNDVYRNCKALIKLADNPSGNHSNDDWNHAGYCVWLLRGIMSMSFANSMLGNGPGYVCLPETGFSVEQAARIVVRDLSSSPEELHKVGSNLAVLALRKAFPCD